jgi:iron complex transport system substrate-binding protein
MFRRGPILFRARLDYELLRRFPGFGPIPAADSGRVYVVNASAYFPRPGPRIVDSLEIPREFSIRESFPTSFRADPTIGA